MCDSDEGSQMPPFQISGSSSYFPQPYMLSMTPYGMECPLGQMGAVVPAVSPLNSLCIHSLLVGGVGLGGAGEALTLS